MLRGVWVPLVTPFKDGIVDLVSYRHLIKHYIDCGAAGLFPLGTTGETPTLDEAEKKVTDAGGTYLAGRPTSPNSFYEAKYRDPNGVVFDLTHTGWAGATKEVTAKA